MEHKPLLEVRHATKEYKRGSRCVRALDDVSFTLQPGEILGIVGESGSGKSTLLRQIACLEHLDSGELLLDGRDVTHAAPRDVCRRVQLVFQDAAASFDPRRTVRQSLYEPLRLLGGEPDPAARVTELLRQVGVPEELADRRPAQLSGGQCQRAAIARALAIEPRLLICDEITSALDVTVQKEILELLNALRTRQGRGLSILFISHDISLVQQFCDRVLVMYRGEIVEEGTPDEVIRNPKNDYTKRLIDSVLS